MAAKDESPAGARVRVWLQLSSRGRGPAPAYSREQIADAAITIAAEHGIDAVTMRKVAAELGTGAMSLYRYVENKDALVELMGDRMLGREEWPELTGDWRKDLADMARGQRAALLAHPWLLEVWGGRSGMGPNALRGFERAMSMVDGLGLTIDDMFETIGLIHTWINGYVRNELDAREFFGDPDDCGHETWQSYVGSIVRSGKYPYLSRVVTEAQAPHIDMDARFERALERILAGIEATLPGAGS